MNRVSQIRTSVLVLAVSQLIAFVLLVKVIWLRCRLLRLLHRLNGTHLQCLILDEQGSTATCEQAVKVVDESLGAHDIVNEPVPFDPLGFKLYPLHLAARHGRPLMTHQLLKLRADPGQECTAGYLATFYALEHGQDVALVRLLMHACPAVDSRGRTVQDYMDELLQIHLAMHPQSVAQPQPQHVVAMPQHQHQQLQQQAPQAAASALANRQTGWDQLPMPAEVLQLVRKLSTKPATHKRVQLAKTAKMWAKQRTIPGAGAVMMEVASKVMLPLVVPGLVATVSFGVLLWAELA